MNPAIPSSALRSDGAGGAELFCRVQPGAARTALAGDYGGRLKIALQAPPVDGRANEALCKFLSKALGIPMARVTITHGLSGRDKRVRLAGIAPEAVQQLLESL